jgi:hypothetical protein
MRSALLIFSTIAIIFVAGCSKTKDETPYTPTPSDTGSCRLLNFQEGGFSANFIYNDDQTISKFWYLLSSTDTVCENYYYTNGHVEKMIRTHGKYTIDTFFYVYNSGRYVELRFNQHGVHQYTYDDSGRISRIDGFVDGESYDHCEFFYDTAGNCIRVDQYSDSQYSSTLEMVEDLEYGPYKNPNYSIGLPPRYSGTEEGFYISPRNITKIRRHQLPGPGTSTKVYTCTSVSGSGYPLSVTISDTLGNALGMEVLQYICP